MGVASASRASSAECFRCTDRTTLRTYTVLVDGKAVGSMRLCDECAGDVDQLSADKPAVSDRRYPARGPGSGPLPAIPASTPAS